MAAQSLKYKRRVLVVDGEAESRTFLCDCLGQWQYEVIQAVSGREALDELQRWQVDIVLLDMAMPHMDGADTLREIMRRYRDMTVFMMSTSMTPRLKQQVIHWGAHGCLYKPIEQSALSLALLFSPLLPLRDGPIVNKVGKRKTCGEPPSRYLPSMSYNLWKNLKE